MEDLHSHPEYCFCLVRHTETGKYYLDIPVSNNFVDYSEWYEIDNSMIVGYPSNIEEIKAFAESCRNHENDHLLLLKPGRNRGVARQPSE